MFNLDFRELNDESELAYIVCSEAGEIFYKNKKAITFLRILDINENANILDSFKRVFEKFNLSELINDKTEVFDYVDIDEYTYYFRFRIYEKKIDEEPCYVFNIYDITEYENEIADSEIYKTIFNSVASAIVVTDTRGTIEKVNPFFQRLTGYTMEEAVGGNPRLLKSGYHSEKFFEEMWQTLSKGEIWRGDLRDKIKSGELIWEKSVISPIKDAAGNIIKYVAIKENITKEKAQEEALKKFSYQDYLTGLYNRRKFMSYAKKLLKYAKDNDENLFCLMVDLDDFKHINDNYGHEVGDKVLVKIANVFKENVRGNDIASRYGGEEFIIILSRYSYGQALKRAEKIVSDIEKTIVETNQNKISVTASVGFASYDNESTVEEWIEMADKALYEAKNTGKNRVCEYNS